MPLALETVVKQLTDSGIIAPGKLENFVPPNAAPKDGEALLRELFKQNLLTKFQAQQVAQGKVKALILGAYTLLDKIGAGGMGQVFKAQHRKMDRLVAIKMLPPAMMKDAAAAARFEREVRAAAKLRHTNIVAADDAAEANGVHFLVMEYVDGEDLSALVKKNGPFPVPKAVNYILQAARGLEFAHSEGVVHRDIKPANLLLDKKGVVKILDMGLARIESDGPTQTELTSTGTIMGTVDYMSPEQALNTKNADHRADIYSLGISLYFLLAGKAAYGGESAMEKLMAHSTQPIPSLQEVQTTVPKQLDAVFRMMVAKRIEDRYQSMSEVIEALEGLGFGGSTTGKGDVASTRALSAAERKKLAAQAKKRPRGLITDAVASEKTKHLVLKIIGGTFATIIAPILVTYLIKHLEKQDEPHNPPASAPPAATVPPMNTPDLASDVDPHRPAMELGAGDWIGLPQCWKITPQEITGSAEPAGGGLPTYLCSKNIYRDFEFRCEVRLVSGDTGIQIRSAYMDRDKFKLRGPQVDIGPSEGWGSLYGQDWPGISKRVSVDLVNRKTDDFNEVFVRCVRKHVTIKINGQTTIDDDFLTIADEGLVGLQLYTKNTVAAFRHLSLKVLDNFGQPSSPNQPWNTPAFQQWVKATQALPAEKQVEAVSKKLMELNPGFDGELTNSGSKDTPKIEQGVVTDVGLIANHLTDISPVRAFAGLKSLACNGDGMKSEFSDLSPLKGMQLTGLGCSATQVSDLTPLKGMALKNLSCHVSRVADLSPIQGMPLIDLNVSITAVSDLSPLKGMELARINCGGTKVSDISVLKGMPLTTLNCYGTQVSDPSPLEDCKSLTWLGLRQNKVTAASVTALQKALPNCKIEWDGAPGSGVGVQGTAKTWESPAFQQWVAATQKLPAEQQIESVRKKLMESNPGFDGKLRGFDGRREPRVEGGVLKEVVFFTDNVTDISPVRAFSGLKALGCVGSQIGLGKLADLSPLEGLALTRLHCPGNNVSSLAPLQGMPLERLEFNNTRVGDLTPLRGMPLTEANFHGTGVADLSPLAGMKLRSLNCGNSRIADLSPLRAMPLESLQCFSTGVKDISSLETCKSLKFVSLNGTKITPASSAALQRALPNCKIDWDDPAKAVAAQPNQPWNTPVFQAWVKEVQAMPAERQVEAVSKKLMELNPGFDGKLIAPLGGDASKPKIKNGVVTEVALRSKEIVDLSPLRALAGLRTLRTNCGSLVDLSPLNGMSFTVLTIEGCRVSDLSPLAQMPLDSLCVYGTKVSDLRPITGLRLTTLIVMSTPVTELSPLRGMPINYLSCFSTAVSDLSPLHDCPDLKSLDVRHTKVTAAQVDALQKALPNCKIEWDDPTKMRTP